MGREITENTKCRSHEITFHGFQVASFELTASMKRCCAIISRKKYFSFESKKFEEERIDLNRFAYIIIIISGGFERMIY